MSKNKSDQKLTWNNYMELKSKGMSKKETLAARDVVTIILRMKQTTKGNIWNWTLWTIISVFFLIPVFLVYVPKLAKQLKEINIKLKYLQENGLNGVIDIEGWVKSVPGRFTNWNFAYTPERIRRINRSYTVLGGVEPELDDEIAAKKQKTYSKH